ncbi:MAG: Crp/Fnr family transcriptional regulator [Rhizonema sp. NSF051]|nr:Crp/Fnr family transcriptional regulator [Rhizonema sp. NSF051]
MSISNLPQEPIKNHILAALSSAEYQRLIAHLEPVEFEIKQVLYKVGEPITHVYFPHQAIISLVSILEDGTSVEAGIVSNEGMVGLPVIWGSNTTTTTALVQVADGGMRMKAMPLLTEFNRGSELQSLLLRYTQILFTQVTQTAVCNRVHTIEERLARWLLIVSDNMQSDKFLLTQEFIGEMLGCRRSGVTVAASILSRAGIITYKRGNIAILDRKHLEDASCECYSIIKNESARLLTKKSKL